MQYSIPTIAPKPVVRHSNQAVLIGLNSYLHIFGHAYTLSSSLEYTQNLVYYIHTYTDKHINRIPHSVGLNQAHPTNISGLEGLTSSHFTEHMSYTEETFTNFRKY